MKCWIRNKLPFTSFQKSWSIFQKMLTGYILLTIFVVLTTAGISIFLAREYVIDNNMSELSGKAAAIAESLSRQKEWQRMSRMRWKEYESLSNARALYIDPHGGANFLDRQAISTDPEGDILLEVDASSVKEIITALIGGESKTGITEAAFAGTQILYASAPIAAQDAEFDGGVILYRPLTDIGGFTRSFASLLGIAGLMALTLAVLLAWFISRRLTSPLRAITQTARRMAGGQYGERVTIPLPGDEIGQLGATLNLLSEELSEVILRLSDEKAKLEHVFSSIGEGIVAIDKAGAMLHHNDAALELLELPMWPGDAQIVNGRLIRLLDMLRSVMREDQKRQTTWQSRENRSIAALASPIRGNDGEVIGSVALLRDVSESERLEQLRRDYIANISHELRTPLTGIRGMVEPLLDGYIETEHEKAECYQIIYQETLRLQKLIGDLLDMSRLQDGRIQIELEEMELPGILGAAVRRMRDRAVDGEVEMIADAPESLPRVSGNEDRILQVLIILLDNALSFTPPGGRIEVYAREKGHWVAIGVKDTGAGIDPKDLPYIWERFYKADRSRMRTSGTGLGLAIAKLTVEQMGGAIGVSTQLGEGTTFEFTLKRA